MLSWWHPVPSEFCCPRNLTKQMSFSAERPNSQKNEEKLGFDQNRFCNKVFTDVFTVPKYRSTMFNSVTPPFDHQLIMFPKTTRSLFPWQHHFGTLKARRIWLWVRPDSHHRRPYALWGLARWAYACRCPTVLTLLRPRWTVAMVDICWYVEVCYVCCMFTLTQNSSSWVGMDSETYPWLFQKSSNWDDFWFLLFHVGTGDSVHFFWRVLRSPMCLSPRMEL